MKKKILIMAILLLAAAMLFAIPTAVKADKIQELKECETCKEVHKCMEGACTCGTCVAQVITSSGTVTCYDDVNSALNSAKDNDTVLLLQDVTTIPFDVSSGKDSSNTDAKRVTRYADSPATFIFDLNGHKISSSNTQDQGTAVFAVKDGSTITFQDRSTGKTGTIEHTKQGAALAIFKGTATIVSGNYVSSGSENNSQNFAAVSIGDTNGDTSNTGKLTVEGGKINGGISLFGKDSTLTVENGAEITSDSFAIAGNGSASGNNKTENATITINGGTITSTGNAAIYQPNNGTLNVTGGTITGKIGIVARQGKVNVTGGTVVGNGSGDLEVGDAKEENGKTKLPAGAAIVTDNASAGYSDTTLVTITDGTLKSTEGVEPIKSYTKGNGQPTKTDYKVSGGEFSGAFEQGFIENGKAEVSIEKNGKTTYYVGNTAKTAVENATAGSVVKVEQGNLTVTSLPNGVIVSGDSVGAITVTNPNSSGSTASALKSNLQALIAKAEGEENKTEGLTNAISAAKTILANPGATYGDLQQALATLQSAYDNFKNGTENNNQEIVSENESNTTGDKGKLDEEPKMGESLTVFGVIAACAVLMLVIKSRKSSRI